MNRRRPSHSHIRRERTGWRDLDLNQRHRRWGMACPAVDIDFLLLEYDRGKATALFEYKAEYAPPQYPTQPSYLALIDLADRAGVPVFAVRYAIDFSWWKVTPLNEPARHALPERTQMTEREFVTFLYRLRGLSPPHDLFDWLDEAI